MKPWASHFALWAHLGIVLSQTATAFENTAFENTAVENTAVENTAIVGTAFEDTAFEDTAFEDTAFEDTAVEGTAFGKTLRVLIISGANNHDWEWTSPFHEETLEKSGFFECDITNEPAATLADAAKINSYDCFFLDYNGPRFGPAAEANFLAAVQSGKGVVVVHAANNAFPGWKEYETLVGLCWREGTGHGRFHNFDVEIVDRAHPITRNLQDLNAHPDELYHGLVHMHDAPYRLLAHAKSSTESGGSGQHEPMATVAWYGKGRVFHTPLGHVWKNSEESRSSLRDPRLQDLLVRGTQWAATGDVQDGLAPNSLSQEEEKAGFRLLFDGRTTSTFRGYREEAFPKQGWLIEGDCLKVQGGGNGGDIITVDKFENFELQFEFKCSPGANSGILYLVTEEGDASYFSGPEFQVLDDFGHPGLDSKHGAGGLYDMIPANEKILQPAGTFNRARIVLHDGNLQHWLNDKLVVACKVWDESWTKMVANSKFKAWPIFGVAREGHIAIQEHGNDVWYRNIKIRELASRASESAPASSSGTEIALFNGKDLSGWTSFVQDGTPQEKVWSIDSTNGILHCSGVPAGYIRTEASFENFVLRLEWRFDPVTKQAGNSGVLIRKIGDDLIWPKSIEAQLLSGHAGDFWNIGEFPMKTDDSRRNGRNTKKTSFNENPVGEWNQYEIIADGTDVTLKVNGKILNQAWDVQSIPGQICLQSEGAPIQFRNIRITLLGNAN